MNQANDIFEYEWWKVLIGYLVLFVVSIVILVAGYFGVQMATTVWPIIRLSGLLLLGSMGLFFSILGIWTIRYVPKLIIFKQNNINVVFPLGLEKVFLY